MIAVPSQHDLDVERAMKLKLTLEVTPILRNYNAELVRDDLTPGVETP